MAYISNEEGCQLLATSFAHVKVSCMAFELIFEWNVVSLALHSFFCAAKMRKLVNFLTKQAHLDKQDTYWRNGVYTTE